MPAESASIASRASGPAAASCTVAPLRRPMAMTAMMLLALADSPSCRNCTSAANPLARLTRVAAGRACRPVGLRIVSSSEVSIGASPPVCDAVGCGVPVAPEAAPAGASPASVTRAATSRPAFTMPMTGSIEATRSPLAMTTWVRTLSARCATNGRSNRTSSSPTWTFVPTSAWTSKPSPFIRTVSRPMCMSTSSPSVERTVTAWRESWTWATSPSTGATRTPTRG